MITFYKADETDFDNNGLGVLDHDIQNPDIEEKLNDIFTFSFNYPIFGVNGSRLAARMIVKADDPENEGQLFRIMKLSKSNGMLTAFCYHIFYDLNGNEIPDTNIVGQNGQTAITQMLSKTAVAHKFQGFSDIAETANIRVVRMSPVKFLIDPQTDNNFINRLGGEIRRVNYRIWMNKVRGSDNGATIRWKKSLDSYNATWDYTTIATRIRPVGYNGIMLPESYVDSPLIDKYETIVIKEIQYSDIKAIDPNATSNDETAVPLEQAYELLRQAAAKEFSGNNLDKPTVTLSVNMVALRNMDEYKDVESLETINPWDTVTVINERDGLSVKVRLNHYHWNPVTHKFISMELGNAKSTFTDIGSKVDHATNIANQANDTAKRASASADGKNTIYRDAKHEDIVNPVNGDTCFEKNGDKEEIWIYNGKSVPPSWELIVDDATGEEVRQNVDAAQKEAEEANKQANKAVDGANDAVTKAGFATDTATQAKSDAASALQKALDAYNHGDQIKTGLTADIDAVKGQVSLKANQVDVDKLGGRVTDAEAQIKLQADQIKLTVSKTELTNVLGDYATQTWTQGKLSLTESTFKTQISSVTNQVNNLNIGVRNLIPNGSFNDGFKGWTVGNSDGIYLRDEYRNNNRYTMFNGKVSNIGIYADLQNDAVIPLQPNTEYILRIITRSVINNHTLSFLQEWDSTGKLINDHAFFVTQTDPTHYSENIQKFTTSATADHGTFRIRVFPGDQFVGGEIILVQGNRLPKDWVAAPEDMATVAQFTSIEETLNGVQITANNAVTQSQYTQLANQFTTTIANVGNGGTNLLYDGGFESGKLNGLPAFYNNSLGNRPLPRGNYAVYLYATPATVNDDKTWYWSLPNPIVIKANQYYVISYDYSAAGSATTASDYAIDNAGNVIFGIMMEHTAHDMSDQSVWKRYKKIFRLSTDTTITKLRFGWVANSLSGGWKVIDNVQIEDGSIAHPYSPSQNDLATSSQFTQLQNDINLRVKTGDLINQINISPEGILIDGQKVHITGQTTIDNAVIKDAMIADIKADKITAGTLNAANVNVINLNATNITTGTIKGANLAINLNTGEVLFQKGAIRSTNGNLNIHIDDGSMSLTNSLGNGAYFKDGNIYMTDSDFWTPGNPKIQYGTLKMVPNFLSDAGGGVALKGPNGVVVGTDEYSDTGILGDLLSSTSGGGITLTKKHIRMASEGDIGIAGGKVYNAGFVGELPAIQVGIAGSYTAPMPWFPSGETGDALFLSGKVVGVVASRGTGNLMTNTISDLSASCDARSGYVLSAATYKRTYGSGDTVTITPNGVFGRISSASKYKLAIGEISTLNDEAHQFLSVKPKQWFDKSESEALADSMTTGNTDYVDDAKALPHNGFIAEDLYTAGLDSYVIRSNDGSIESIQYDRLPVLHHELIRELFNRLDAAEMEIYKLKQEVLNNAN